MIEKLHFSAGHLIFFFSSNRIPWVESIVVVVAKESHELMLQIIHQFQHAKVKVVEGGTTRHRSIFNGLQAFSESAEGPVLPRPKVVIIHDAVRPFIEEDFLLKITLAAKEQGVRTFYMHKFSTVWLLIYCYTHWPLQ